MKRMSGKGWRKKESKSEKQMKKREEKEKKRNSNIQIVPALCLLQSLKRPDASFLQTKEPVSQHREASHFFHIFINLHNNNNKAIHAGEIEKIKTIQHQKAKKKKKKCKGEEKTLSLLTLLYHFCFWWH